MAMKAWSLKKVISKEKWKFSVIGKWKSLNLQMAILDNVFFRIMSIVEVIVLVSTLCFFYLCCGCHF